MSLIQISGCLVLALLLTTEAERADVDFTKDTLAVVKKNVAEGKAVLVDVRSQSEWNKGHVDGAIFLPIDSLRKKVDPKMLAAKLSKKKVLYTYCVVGMRARAAAKKLEQHGYTVRALKPGYDDLIKAGFKKAEKKTEVEQAAANDEDTRQRNAG